MPGFGRFEPAEGGRGVAGAVEGRGPLIFPYAVLVFAEAHHEGRALVGQFRVGGGEGQAGVALRQSRAQVVLQEFFAEFSQAGGGPRFAPWSGGRLGGRGYFCLLLLPRAPGFGALEAGFEQRAVAGIFVAQVPGGQRQAPAVGGGGPVEIAALLHLARQVVVGLGTGAGDLHALLQGFGRFARVPGGGIGKAQLAVYRVGGGIRFERFLAVGKGFRLAGEDPQRLAGPEVAGVIPGAALEELFGRRRQPPGAGRGIIRQQFHGQQEKLPVAGSLFQAVHGDVETPRRSPRLRGRLRRAERAAGRQQQQRSPVYFHVFQRGFSMRGRVTPRWAWYLPLRSL